jgi:hypothetical protein
MAHTVEEYRPMNVRQLYDHMTRFAQDNNHSNDVDTRWLATKVEAFAPTVASVMNSRLGPEDRASVNAFRANEIEVEVEKKRRELDVLERSLKQIKAA